MPHSASLEKVDARNRNKVNALVSLNRKGSLVFSDYNTEWSGATPWMAVKICLRIWRAGLDQNSLNDLSHFQKLVQIRRFLQIQVRSELDGGGAIGG